METRGSHRRRPWACPGTAVALALLLLASGDALARSGGVDGYSGNPATQSGQICTACHGGGLAPTVTLDGPTLVQPMTVHTYTLTITGGQQIAGGLDVSAAAGTLAVTDAGTYLRNGEITHNAPRGVDGAGAVSWNFNWTSPPSPGSYTLYGAGNSVNLANGNNGDDAAADTLTITVATASGPGETSGAASAPLLATGFDPLTGEISISYETGCGTTDNNIYFGPLDQVANLGWTGEECAIGASGSHDTFNPGPDSYFFVVVGNAGATEGSYGLAREPDGDLVERQPFGGNACGELQGLSNRCD